MIKRIAFSKYQDLILTDDAPNDYPGAYASEFEEDSGNLEMLKKQQVAPYDGILGTANGFILLSAANLASKQFNFWIADTTFLITKDILDILNEGTVGIEELTILSPYRFRFAVGRLFDETEVKLSIIRELGCISNDINILDVETREKVKELTQALESQQFWCVYVIPNSEIVSFTSKHKEEVLQKCNFFEGVQELISGVLIKSVELRNGVAIY